MANKRPQRSFIPKASKRPSLPDKIKNMSSDKASSRKEVEFFIGSEQLPPVNKSYSEVDLEPIRKIIEENQKLVEEFERNGTPRKSEHRR